jgi:hypothetical protein
VSTFRIKLIVTGALEKSAMHASLRRYFPDKVGDKDVTWDMPRKTDGATSHPLVAGALPSKPMRNLAKIMIVESCERTKTGPPADRVIVLDDVELANLGNEKIVVEHFRAAVNAEIGSYPAIDQQRMRSVIREKCSFHLIRPMIEGYFFTDTGALSRAGVSPQVVPSWTNGTDSENLECTDPAWLPTCQKENELRANLGWWRHERHSKHYLESLVGRSGLIYSETTTGARALQDLDWPKSPKVADDISVIRCLFEDISLTFGVESPLGHGVLNPHLFPTVATRPADLVLRNI